MDGDDDLQRREIRPAEPDQYGLCWCCQGDILRGEAVRLDKISPPIPCCRGCWARIPESQRMHVGLAMLRHREMQSGDTLEDVRRLIETLLSDRADQRWPFRN
jgi:hypothetical protein